MDGDGRRMFENKFYVTLILRLSDASDVDGSVDSEPAAITELEGSWPELAADLDDLDVLSSS